MGEALQYRDIDHRQAYNCEIMLSKVKVSLHDLVDEIDILWNAKDQFPKDFRAEILFSEMDAAAYAAAGDISSFEEEGLPVEAVAKVQEFFS
ncbi:formin-like protein 6 [Carya illinoinensis]|uniref:formin-like protein 6 n=1 Tax=Carya illinoinensis TaxID=32201 RepID=UPI001C71EB5B|nr:formin-like protein 6 [Carya illinoinensis]